MELCGLGSRARQFVNDMQREGVGKVLAPKSLLRHCSVRELSDDRYPLGPSSAIVGFGGGARGPRSMISSG